MLYKKFRSVPANTTEAAPDHQILKVTKGVIKQWVIFFDPESANVLHVRVEYKGSSIMPFGGKEWLVGFFTDTPLDDNIKLDAPPYELHIYAWNEDDTYPHEYYIHPIILRDSPVSVEGPDMTIPERFVQFFRGA